MKTIILLIPAIVIFLSAQAQKPEASKLSAGDYFNNFQRFTNESPNVNLAFVNIQKLASNPDYEQLATILIHNVFAQEFIHRPNQDEAQLEMRAKRRLLASQILDKMVLDTSAIVRQQVHPLLLLTKVQLAANDTEELTRLTEQFIVSEIDGRDIYSYRSARYGLMILNELLKHAVLEVQSKKLMDKLAGRLGVEQVIVTDSSSRAALDKRAWYRFLNACINFTKSQQTDDKLQEENLLKVAFEYSPDLVDKNHHSGYFYDMVMIFGEEKEGFQEEYLEFIINNPDKQKVMATLLKMALVEPSFKENVRAVYHDVMPGKSFDDYWMKGINASAVKAPPITLTLLTKKSLSSKSFSGQWTLVDFWGTWCGPCREEHPALQKFYDSIVVEKPGKVTLVTVACRDTESKVTAYMAKMKYIFPVAMSDNKIEKSFKLHGYPTKILITPAGKYVTVPFGVDWVSFVNKYVEASN